MELVARLVVVVGAVAGTAYIGFLTVLAVLIALYDGGPLRWFMVGFAGLGAVMTCLFARGVWVFLFRWREFYG